MTYPIVLKWEMKIAIVLNILWVVRKTIDIVGAYLLELTSSANQKNDLKNATNHKARIS